MNKRFIYFLYVIYAVYTSNITCDVSQCISCGYDITCKYQIFCSNDNFMTCLKCADKKSCYTPPCDTQFCNGCDSTMTYCNSCTQYYQLASDSCRLNSKMRGIIIFLFGVACLFSAVFAISLIIFIIKIANNKSNSISQIKSQQIDLISNITVHSNNICAICYEDSCNLITKCGHSFHPKCLRQWIKRRNSCPYCNTYSVNIVIIIKCLKCKKVVQQKNLRQFDDNSEQGNVNLCMNNCSELQIIGNASQSKLMFEQ